MKAPARGPQRADRGRPAGAPKGRAGDRSGAAKPAGPPERTYAVNRRARYEYAITETLEVGVVLTGSEIKSIRAGRCNLTEAYARYERGELWLLGAHISPYEPSRRANHDPVRPRKLLAHAREIGHLAGLAAQPGYTLVPLRLYDRNGYVKALLGLGRGKRQYEKRETIAKRDADRDIARALRRDR